MKDVVWHTWVPPVEPQKPQASEYYFVWVEGVVANSSCSYREAWVPLLACYGIDDEWRAVLPYEHEVIAKERVLKYTPVPAGFFGD